MKTFAVITARELAQRALASVFVAIQIARHQAWRGNKAGSKTKTSSSRDGETPCLVEEILMHWPIPTPADF